MPARVSPGYALIVDKMTPEQEKVLAEVYNLKEGAELTSEEIDKAIEMFNSPESFIILRKVLGIASYADRGITLQNPAKWIYWLQKFLMPLSSERRLVFLKKRGSGM